MPYGVDWDAAGEEAVRILQELIRLNTTNPPGNERIAADYITRLLADEGIESTILESAPGRANLLARLRADGAEPTAAPLLLLGHTDVVYADPDEWTYPPFGGEVHDGHIWGRGALDMKNLVTMELMTVLLIKRLGTPLKRDLIFLAVADEESMGHYGAEWMLDNHRDLIDAEYVLNEGGRGSEVDGRKAFWVSTAEKGYGDLGLTVRGAAGHAAMPRGLNPVVELSRAVAAIADYRAPVHATGSAAAMFDQLRELVASPSEHRTVSGGAKGGGLPDEDSDVGVRAGTTINRWLDSDAGAKLPEEIRHMLAFGIRNVFSPTMFSAGMKENVIPNRATANLNTRVLPGVTLTDLLGTVQDIVGPDVEIEVKEFHAGTESAWDTPLFEVIESVVGDLVPGGRVSPYLLPAATDSRFFRSAGIKAYGFSPIVLPSELAATVHGKDERMPIEGLRLGTQRLFEVVTRFCAAEPRRPEPRDEVGTGLVEGGV
jgi:acetylornithine deacetylase/succinyl-diaminopimelate desuccinylase-like protein